MARVQVAFVAAVIFLAGAVGYAVGSREAVPGRTSVDVGFLYDMIGHHEQAVTMSNLELVKHGDPSPQRFAREILYFQGYEIGLMTQRLRSWGHPRDNPPPRAMAWMGHGTPREQMPGMASEDEITALSNAAPGAAADALFFALMIDHHAGGVHMADEAARRARTGFVRDLADRVRRQQRTEIREMELARDRLGLPARPPGFEPSTE